jgi:hypothetical protein
MGQGSVHNEEIPALVLFYHKEGSCHAVYSEIYVNPKDGYSTTN